MCYLNKPKLINLVIFTVFCILILSVCKIYAYGQNSEYIEQNRAIYTKDTVSILINDVKGRLETIDKEAEEGSYDDRLGDLLKKQISVANELLTVIEQKGNIVSVEGNIDEELNNKKKELEYLSSNGESSLSGDPNQEEFDLLTEKVKRQRERVIELKDQIDEYDELNKSAPEQEGKTIESKTKVENLIDALNDKIRLETNPNEKELLLVEMAIAKMEQHICAEKQKFLDANLGGIKQLSPLLTAELLLEEKRLEIFEKELDVYSISLEQALKVQQQKTEKNLAHKEAKIAKAETPEGKLVARWEARQALSQKNKSDLDSIVVSQQRIFNLLDNRLQSEKEKLQYFSNRLKRLGASAFPADRIKRELKRLKKLRKSLKKILPKDYKTTREQYDAREFEIDDELQNFDEIWTEGYVHTLSTLSIAEQKEIVAKRTEMEKGYRDVLNKEKEALLKFIDLDQKIQKHILDRHEVLEEIERIVWSTMFWIQDGSPINFEMIKELPGELMIIGNWAKKTNYTNVSKNILLILETFNGILFASLLFVVFPFMLIALRIRLDKFVTNYNRMTIEYGHKWKNKINAVIVGISGSLTLPIYLFVFAKIIGKTGLPNNISYIFELICIFSSAFFLLYFLNRAFFRVNGIAVVQFGLNSESAKVLYRAIKVIIIASTSLRFSVTVAENVFALSAIPSLLLLSELIIIGVTIWLALLGKSALVKNEILLKNVKFLTRYWTLISYVIFLIIICAWVLAITGYSYAASQFMRSLLRSIVAGFLIPSFYKLAVSSIENISRKRKRLLWEQSHSKDEEEDKKEEEIRLTDQAKSFVRVFFYVIGGLIAANLWGLDSKAFKTFDEIIVYKLTTALNEYEVVSVSDLFSFFLIILITIWFLKNLAGITEYAIFSRLKIESGVKYAILTIARYSIFCIAAIIALASVHLDIGRLGWLIAAMGVGLGFGLQEIVSNFVCGIILLIERPIRVEDYVTIGTSMGRVTHINIRATTILNFDRQEFIVPNRLLITQEVINWTRGDTVIRLIIPIGVAYGSDTKKVNDLLLDIAKREPNVLDDPAPDVFFINHGDSSLDFELRVFLHSPLVKMRTLDTINKEINRVFTGNGIEIPFPQRDINVKNN